MTRLPNADDAVVPHAKVRDYLLYAAHPKNGGKAAFFERFGFGRAAFLTLADALRFHPIRNPMVETVPIQWGMKYIVQCTLLTPDGRNPCIQSIWIIEAEGPPRLVSAYPRPPGAPA